MPAVVVAFRAVLQLPIGYRLRNLLMAIGKVPVAAPEIRQMVLGAKDLVSNSGALDCRSSVLPSTLSLELMREREINE